MVAGMYICDCIWDLFMRIGDKDDSLPGTYRGVINSMGC